jgi:tetratricopeptide (TPR) repeat protein
MGRVARCLVAIGLSLPAAALGQSAEPDPQPADTALPAAQPALPEVPAQPEADPYATAFERAAAQEKAGDLAAAARTLEAILPAYPQDYDLTLRLAWIYFQSGRNADAERLYRAALKSGGDPATPTLGLAFALQRQRRCGEAVPAFRRALSLRPNDPTIQKGAADGLRLCKQTHATVGLHLGYQALVGTSLSSALIISPRLDLSIGRFYLGVVYRVRPDLNTALVTTTTTIIMPRPPMPGMPPMPPLVTTVTSTLDILAQHEAYLALGYHAPIAGFTARYGLTAVQYGQSTTNDRRFAPAHHVGLTLRYSPFGDGLLNLATSIYPGDKVPAQQGMRPSSSDPDVVVFRAEPSWRFPIRWGLSARPGLAAQWSPLGPTISGFGEITLDRPGFAVFAGGKGGPEHRPPHLDLPVVYNFRQIDRVIGGAWAGGTLKLGRHHAWHINLTYAFDRLEGQVPNPQPIQIVDPMAPAGMMVNTVAASLDSHVASLGLSREF